MKRIGKFISLVITLLMLFSILAACGGTGTSKEETSAAQNNSNQATTGQATTAEPTKAEPSGDLKFVHWRVEDIETLEAINEDFKAKYPKVNVIMDAVPTDQYPNLVNVRLAANEADVFGSYSYIRQLSVNPGPINSGKYLDLTGQPFLDNYTKSSFIPVTMDGKIIAVSTSQNALLVYYNKNMFSELGIQVPTKYSDFLAVCEKLKTAGKIPMAFGGKDVWPIDLYSIFVETCIVRQKTPDFYNRLKTGESKFTDPEWIEVITKVNELSKYFQPQFSATDYGQAPMLFTQGKAAMYPDASWTAAQIANANPEFEVGVFAFPGNDIVDPSTVVPAKDGLNLAINKDSANIPAALAYLEFISTKEVYKKYITGVKQLPTQTGIEFDDKLMNEISKLLATTTPLWEDILPPPVAVYEGDALIKLVLGKSNVQQCAEELQALVDKSLQEKK